MPTPYGSRGGMAFGAEELRVLRRALALALHSGPASAEDVQDCRRLAESLDEAMCEAARLRAFLVADLARYRAALPGTAAGYLTLLGEVLAAGHRTGPDDLAALRALRGNPVAAALLDRCERLAETDVRALPARRTARRAPGAAVVPAPSRRRLPALPGGRDGLLAVAEERPPGREREEPRRKPAERPSGRPAERPSEQPGERRERPERPAAPAKKPAPARPPAPTPAPERRPIPTPGEVFPRRKPTPPPADPERGRQRLAAV